MAAREKEPKYSRQIFHESSAADRRRTATSDRGRSTARPVRSKGRTGKARPGENGAAKKKEDPHGLRSGSHGVRSESREATGMEICGAAGISCGALNSARS